MEFPKDLSKFILSSTKSEKEAHYVLFGVPEHSGSDGLAYFEGSEKGPAALRKASQLYCAFHRTENGSLKTFISNSFQSIPHGSIGFFDVGNKKRDEVKQTVLSLLEHNKFPIVLGGDHSITYEILRGVNEYHGRFAVVYFDTHPDFRSSKKAGKKNYATVMYDTSQLPHFSGKHSIQIGISDIESEEFENMKHAELVSLTPLAIEGLGMQKTLRTIKSTIKNLPVYVSLDLDVLDQAFASAVAEPSPCGLSSRELLFLLTGLAGNNIIGLDVMENTPGQNGNLMTSTVGARLLIEFIVRHNAYNNNRRAFRYIGMRHSARDNKISPG